MELIALTFCPGFLCDCLETLEEINMQSETNISSGGKNFNYIPALNDDEENILSLETIILNEVSNWDNIKINFEKFKQNKRSFCKT